MCHTFERARQFVDVDFHFEVIVGGGGNQVVGASHHVQAVDFGTDASHDGLFGLIATNGSQLDVIDIQTEHIGAAIVTDGHITSLTGIVAQIDSVLIPRTLTVTITGVGSSCTKALRGHRPGLEGGEIRGTGIASSRNGDTKFLGSP